MHDGIIAHAFNQLSKAHTSLIAPHGLLSTTLVSEPVATHLTIDACLKSYDTSLHACSCQSSQQLLRVALVSVCSALCRKICVLSPRELNRHVVTYQLANRH